MRQVVQRYPMTIAGFAAIKEELNRLKAKVRPQIVRAIETARAHGDLSENAEYNAAKEKQGFVEAQIRNLETKTAHAQIIDISQLSGKKVLFGATVIIYDHESDSVQTWQIVGEEEADLSRRKLSLKAPIAKALIGKYIGDKVEIKTPKGAKICEIMNVVFKA